LQTIETMVGGNRRIHEPPGYHEQVGSETDMVRPTAALLAGERYGSTRRLLNTSGSSVRE